MYYEDEIVMTISHKFWETAKNKDAKLELNLKDLQW